MPSAARHRPSSFSSCVVSTVPSSLSHPQLVAPVCFCCRFLSRSPSTICTGCKCFNFAGKALLLTHGALDIDDTFRLHHLATSHWTGSYWPWNISPRPPGYSCPCFGSCDCILYIYSPSSLTSSLVRSKLPSNTLFQSLWQAIS
jgi:hypothetical protein